MLDPVLERRLVKKGKSWVLQLADKEVRPLCNRHLIHLHAYLRRKVNTLEA